MIQAALGSNVHFLNRDEFVFNGPGAERIRFLGATLWTDFAVYGDAWTAMNDARRGSNDFAGRIRLQGSGGLHCFRPEDGAEEHVLSREWLAQRLAEQTADGCTTIVVTHHAPSSRSIAPQWQGHKMSPCFASDLPSPFFEVPQLWVHGHVHDSFDYRRGATRILANPRGYRMRHESCENKRFEPGLIIDTSQIGSVDAETPANIIEAEVLSKALRRVAWKLGLTTDVLASVMGTSVSVVTSVLVDRTWMDPQSMAGLRALKLIQLFGSLSALVGSGDENRRAWLNGISHALNGSPIQLIQTTKGLDAVVKYLDGMRER